MSDEFSAHLKKAGTTRRLTVHDTPEHNGISERGNHTNLEIVHAVMHDSGLPKFLWPEAVSYAVYVRNRTWNRVLGNYTPYELLTGRKPNVRDMHPWGCKVRVHDTDGTKLDGRSKVGRWMGFDPDTKDGHRVFWPEKRSVSVERSVKFNFSDEAVVRLLPIEGETPTDATNPTVTPQKPTNTVEIDPEPVEGRGKRIRKEFEYMRMLRDGTATTGQRTMLPKGMQLITQPTCYDFLSFFVSLNVSSHYAVSSFVGLIHASSIVSPYVLSFVLYIVSSLFYYRFIHRFDYLYV